MCVLLSFHLHTGNQGGMSSTKRDITRGGVCKNSLGREEQREQGRNEADLESQFRRHLAYLFLFPQYFPCLGWEA